VRIQRGARSVVVGVAGACLVTAAVGVLAATPAQAARTSASLTLGPNSGAPTTQFTASFHMNARGGLTACLGGQVTFNFDAVPAGSGALDQTCTATATLTVPPTANAGPHTVMAAASGAAQSASANATFTVTAGQPSTPSTPGAPSTPTAPTTPATPTSSASPSWSNSTTPYPGWTAPPFASQVVPTSIGLCDTQNPHATAAGKGFLQIPAYSVGAHPANNGSTVITEPAAGSLPILSVGPNGMIPPQLGDGRHPYQNLELLESIDANVSPKLRLAAAAGEPFGCLHVESFGGPGSGYGYLSYALRGATVISVQDANADGSLFQTAEPSIAAPTTPAAPAPSGKDKKSKAPASTPAPPPAPTAKFERVVLGYSSLSWEYQEAAGGAQAPIHRGAGTIVPPPPSAPLSYSNLVFAFGGLVAAAVALMFAYHSRRRDLARRQRRRRASHAS
jgi:hypothetical protein